MNPSDSSILFLAFLLSCLCLLTLIGWWTADFAERRERARKGLAVFLLGVSAINGLLMFTETSGTTRITHDGGAWQFPIAVVFGIAGAAVWRLKEPEKNRRRGRRSGRRKNSGL